jgi:hypothetical protein
LEDAMAELPPDAEHIDLRSEVIREELTEGENHVYTDSDGISLVAVVKDSELSWRVTDEAEAVLDVEVLGRAGEDSCTICVRIGLRGDRYRCWTVPYPCRQLFD